MIALAITWIVSALLAGVTFSEIDPRSGEPLRIVNQLSLERPYYIREIVGR